MADDNGGARLLLAIVALLSGDGDNELTFIGGLFVCGVVLVAARS